MKKTVLLFASALVAGASAAQISVTGSSLNYTQDFNSLDTVNISSSNLPAGWSIYETGSSTTTVNNQYKGSNGSGNSGDTYSYGAAGSNERALGSLASGSNKPSFGARFANNTGAAITSFSLTYQGEQWRRGTNSSPDSLVFSYSTNALGVDDVNATWTAVTTLTLTSINNTTTTGMGIDGNVNATSVSGNVTLTLPSGSFLTIKWSDPDVAGSDDGLAVDDLTITFTAGTPPAPLYHPNITALSPADNSMNVPASATTLNITFDKGVSAGTGNILITNETDQTIQTIAANSASVTTNGNIATITGVNLALGKMYHVTLDSAAFDTAGYKSSGIYDTTTWNFSTSLPAITFLSETFDAACGATPSNLPVGWMKYSVTGAQQWNCYSFGYNNTPCISMNGYQGGNNANEDWLITPEINLTLTNPRLIFNAFKKYAGDDIQVLVSNNYDGVSDPSSTSFTWNDLNIDFSTVDTNWHIYSGYLNPYQTSDIYIAFKYTSSTTNGAQWKLDNIQIITESSVSDISRASLQFAVTGTASQNEMKLNFNVKEGTYTLSIYDLAGRNVYNEKVNLTSGAQQKTINGFSLARGMYLVKLENGKDLGIAKAIVE